MDKIYVIISGEYSDWGIEGFAKTEEEATILCLKHNQDTKWYDEWGYYEADILKCDVDKSKLRYRFDFYINKDKVNKCYKILESSYNRVECALVENRIYKRGLNRYKIVVYIRKKDEELAEKVMWDFFYKYLYEQEQ